MKVVVDVNGEARGHSLTPSANWGKNWRTVELPITLIRGANTIRLNLVRLLVRSGAVSCGIGCCSHWPSGRAGVSAGQAESCVFLGRRWGYGSILRAGVGTPHRKRSSQGRPLSLMRAALAVWSEGRF